MKPQTFISPAPGNTQLLFMPSLYNDTLDLLIEARDYFTHFANEDQARLNANERLVYSSEMSRITLRLSSVMAWLLARRASTGGMAKDDSPLHEYTLPFRDVCQAEAPEVASIMPAYVKLLLERTYALYVRVSRLDDMAVTA